MNNKLEELQNKIKVASAKTVKLKRGSNISTAFSVATDLVSGAIVGVIIGLFFDQIFDSKPLFLIICILLGVIASFKNIWQSTK